MKIVRIIARLNVGGPARHVAWLTSEMRRDGHDAMLVAGIVPPGETDMSDFARTLGIEPVIIPEMSREISARDAVTVWKLYRLFHREKPDIVHTHTAKAGTAGRVAGMLYRWLTPSALLGRGRPCRFVHTYHGHVFHSYYGRLKTKFFLTVERLLARFATDRIVVISPRQFAEIHGQFGVGRAEQFRIVPLGLDLDVFADPAARRAVLRHELKATDDEILVGIVGRLTEVKDHKFFLNSAARYKEVYAASSPRVRFVIIGDGHLRDELEAEAARLGLKDDVVFLGLRRDPEFFYPALDVVALASLNEGTPLTLIEAMANSRPVVATDVGGVGDLLGESLPVEQQIGRQNDEDGYRVCAHGALVTTRDANAFAHALRFLITNTELRHEMGARGREFVMRGYSKRRLLDDITALYKELLTEDRPYIASTRKRVVEAPYLKGE